MRGFLLEIDRLLRGEYTRPEDLRSGQIGLKTRILTLGGLFLGASYGVFMGIYGATRPENGTVMQLVATTVKVPLLFLLTLLVCFPSLYVLSTLAGSRLRFQHTMRLLLAAIAIDLALLASLGPVVGFFTLSTDSYPFMVVLNVVFFTVAGIAGLAFLRRALRHVFAPDGTHRERSHAPIAITAEATADVAPADPNEPDVIVTGEAGENAEAPPVDEGDEAPQEPRLANERRLAIQRMAAEDRGLGVFRAWLVVFAIVGAQMGWVLRPFIGTPELPFTWFREREGNFFQGFLEALRQMLS